MIRIFKKLTILTFPTTYTFTALVTHFCKGLSSLLYFYLRLSVLYCMIHFLIINFIGSDDGLTVKPQPVVMLCDLVVCD